LQTNKQCVFLCCPYFFSKRRAEVIYPSFAALLSRSIWDSLGNISPILNTEFGNCFTKQLIFVGCPFGFAASVVGFGHRWR
jgi:hypothetical protein